MCLPAAVACWCRCAQTQWTLSSLWQGASMDGGVQLSPSTSHCRAFLRRKWPEPWQTRQRGHGVRGSEGGPRLCYGSGLARIATTRTHEDHIPWVTVCGIIKLQPLGLKQVTFGTNNSKINWCAPPISCGYFKTAEMLHRFISWFPPWPQRHSLCPWQQLIHFLQRFYLMCTSAFQTSNY